jgi:hypothetical protein
LFCAVIPASAIADVFMAHPGPALEQSAASSGTAGVVEPNVAGGTFRCAPSWPQTTVANHANSYAIGNCAGGVHMHRTDSYLISGTYWDGGNIYGDMGGGCGFVDDLYMEFLGSASPPGCQYWDLGDFSSANNAGQCPEAGTDGCAIVNAGYCDEYANFQPWPGGNHIPAGLLRTVPPSNGRLKYRYTTKTDAAPGSWWGGKYVMVRDQDVPTGYGNWVFVVQSCL